MTRDDTAGTGESELKRLEARLDELIHECGRLKGENLDLRRRHALLLEERAALMDKTTQARSRVHGVIERLRTLERAP